MRALLERLNTLCHPFPGTHILGLSVSAIVLATVILWPTSGQTIPDALSSMPLTHLLQSDSQSQRRPSVDPEWRIAVEEVSNGDSLSALFQRQKLSAQLLVEVTRNEGRSDRISRLKVGQQVEFRYDGDDLKEVAVIHSPFHKTVSRFTSDQKWTVDQEFREAEIYIEHARGQIDSSLFLAGARAGLPDNLIMELANIYGNVIDFVYEIREGDSFFVTFEKRYLDGEFIEYGNILAAEFINNKESFIAVRYTDTEGDTGYYDQQGVSLRKAFLRAPLNFKRVSSNFKLARKHPVLGLMRAHKGTDYAAPTGTPVYAAGDGKITHRARNGGYGNLVVVRHGNGIETRYAHLSKFGRYGVGSKVKQGQVIGYVGATGLATGPHLHYEFVVNGAHRNPRTILDKLPKAKTLAKVEMPKFERIADPLIASLEAQRSNAELALQTIRQ